MTTKPPTPRQQAAAARRLVTAVDDLRMDAFTLMNQVEMPDSARSEIRQALHEARTRFWLLFKTADRKPR